MLAHLGQGQLIAFLEKSPVAFVFRTPQAGIRLEQVFGRRAGGANFHGALEQAMSAPIGQFAQSGGAFWGSARDYFRSPAFKETPPKLVIWEIPERVVNQPIGEEEAAFLHNWRGQ